MGKASKLKFNIDDLTEQAAALREVADGIDSARTELTDKVETLQGEWVSGASTEFFSTYNDEWLPSLNSCCDMLESLASALETAVREYEPLEQEYNRLDLDV